VVPKKTVSVEAEVRPGGRLFHCPQAAFVYRRPLVKTNRLFVNKHNGQATVKNYPRRHAVEMYASAAISLTYFYMCTQFVAPSGEYVYELCTVSGKKMPLYFLP